jgi:3-oxoacyl-[acyl-carrier protein] reductase
LKKFTMDKLVNKKAVITGGSRGIGKAIAKAFLENGAEVFLIARNASELAAAQKELADLGKVHVFVADVSKPEDVERAAAGAKKTLGSVNVLINAAGVYGPIGLITDVDPEEWRKAIDINLFGTFLCTRTFAPLMKKSKSATIINFVGGGEGAYPHFSSYVSAKGGIARFTETAAEELKQWNIRVNAIAPGAVNTKFMEDILAAGPEKAGKEAYEKTLKQKESGGVSPEAAGKLCVFLASEVAEGITGKILSAVWDHYESFPDRRREIASTDVYTMRRVRPEWRGFDWEDRPKQK